MREGGVKNEVDREWVCLIAERAWYMGGNDVDGEYKN